MKKQLMKITSQNAQSKMEKRFENTSRSKQYFITINQKLFLAQQPWYPHLLTS